MDLALQSQPRSGDQESITLMARSLHLTTLAIWRILSFLSLIVSWIKSCWEEARFGAMTLRRGTIVRMWLRDQFSYVFEVCKKDTLMKPWLQ